MSTFYDIDGNQIEVSDPTFYFNINKANEIKEDLKNYINEWENKKGA